MEIFYSYDIGAGMARLSPEESAHCCRVLRRRTGDVIQVIDGEGTMYDCRLVDDNPRGAEAEILERHEGWGSHSYDLTMAVCPTKNTDRFEWFAEKAVELGVDCIQPVIGERSERKVLRTDRIRGIALSAAKQSLKARVPAVYEPESVMDFIASMKDSNSLKLIAYCFEGEKRRISITEALSSFTGDSIAVLIGPEGDFSPAEATAALEAGFIPVHLGASRLRTETAAVTAVSAVYFNYL